MTNAYTLTTGTRPLIVSMPHCGTAIPLHLQDDYTPRALATEDTDWHMPVLYDFAKVLGASLIVPHYSRYVIDLNRPPDNSPMYPGASNTELCPTRFFTGDPLYQNGRSPDRAEQLTRLEQYWLPYHDALSSELSRLHRLHGHVLLWDAHSIRSEIPWLFEGRLPDINIGTASGQAAHARICDAVMEVSNSYPAFSFVHNGRFKGGYITRHYGQPDKGVHAVQLEMCQSLYMREVPPFDYLPEKANTIIKTIEAMVLAALTTLENLP